MPLVDIHVIKGVFSKEQKEEIITKVTDTMVAIEGDALRRIGSSWPRSAASALPSVRPTVVW